MNLIYDKGAFFMKGHPLRIADTMAKIENLQGWKYDKFNGWFTTSVTSAFLLRAYGCDRTKKILNKFFINHAPFKGALVIPKGEKLLPHQPGAIRYCLSRNRSYLRADPGLGKTICAAIYMNTLNAPRNVSVVPAGLALNTLDEYQKWMPKTSIGILGSNDWIVPKVLIVPDSIIARPETRDYLRFYNPNVLSIDEVHRYKEATAGRTKAMFGYVDRRKQNPIVPGVVDARNLERLLVMSGTPMPNDRPMELYPLLHKLAPEYIDFANKDHYGMKYCNGHWNGHGYDYSGANVKALKELVGRFRSEDENDEEGFMLRLDKSLLKLPPLSEELVILGDEMSPTLRNADTRMMNMYSPEDIMKKMLKKKHNSEDDLHLSTYRRLLGMHKVKPSAAYIKDILENTDEKLLLFGYHIDVIREMEDALGKYDPLTVTGKTSKSTRHNMVKEFQTNKKKRVFQGNIDAVGVGLTLTKANRVVMYEWSWLDTVNRQAIDRGHRYGLKHPLLAEFLAFKGSLDKAMWETNKRKRRITAIV